MRVNKIQSSGYLNNNLHKSEVKQYVQGDYITIVEIFPDKQIRTIKSIKRNEIICREIFYNFAT